MENQNKITQVKDITPELIEQVALKVANKEITIGKRIRPVLKRKKPLLNNQQKAFISYYTDPKSETFTNAYRSALKAGFKRHYADKILSKPLNWLRELENVIGDERRLRKAERNLEEVQDLDIKNKFGDVDTNIIRERTKVDTFIASALDKSKYSTRVENAVHVKVEHQIDQATKDRLDSLLGL